MTKFLIVTAHHDYRTPRRASIHFIADELAKRGELMFFSLRYSFLSARKDDIRNVIDKVSNEITIHNGAKCFLWKTWLHPFNLRSKYLQIFEKLFFKIYENLPQKVLDKWAEEADFIFYESGIAPLFHERLKKINPKAKHIYRASDDLATINVAEYVKNKFSENSGRMDAVCLVSKAMAPYIRFKENLYLVPHGINENIDELGDPSPYGPGIHAISVGSMLFDVSYFELASHAFPDVTFHVIGSGHPRSALYASNVIVYENMAYSDTIKYIKHANIGVAAYKAVEVPEYLADSSMKMLQYDFFALPTVCPHAVSGGYALRFGYEPDNLQSLKAAMIAALGAKRVSSRKIISWSATTDRLLHPQNYNDTKI